MGLLSLFPSILISQDDGLFTPEKRKAFADYLFCEKDFLRAAEEYEAVNSDNQNDSLKYKIGLCFLKMGEYEKAKNDFSRLRNSSLGEESKLLMLKIAFFQNDGNKESTEPSFKNEAYKTASLRLASAIKIKERITQTNLISLGNMLDENDKVDFNNIFSNKERWQRKSPFAAALFSAMVPGAGKIYTENYGDGITSFIVTGLFAFLAYDNFRAHHNTRAWIFTGTAAFFNAGNIYGSYISARNYNLEREEELNNEFDSFLNSKNYFVPKEIEGSCK
jgi:TM2 domain-containing membrane protein YozV